MPTPDDLPDGRTERTDGAGVPLAPGAGYHAWLGVVAGGHDQVRAYTFFPPRPVRTLPGAPPYADVLAALGVTPYRHQAEALAHVLAGRDVVVASGTASGKSLVFHVPILAELASGGTTLTIFPTKALASDQVTRLAASAHALGYEGGRVARYDGDTDRPERLRARAGADVIVTNPDMLHYGILPFAPSWHRFLSRLSLVVIDEVHAYRGVLGVHVANVVRRLLRVARSLGAEPSIVAASATIGNPAEHLARITGRRAVAVTGDDAPRGAREFVVWRPAAAPGVGAFGETRRRSANTEAAALGAHLARAGVRTLVFCNSRRGAELVRRYLVQALPNSLSHTVASYRGGYTAEDRHAIAAAFRAGDVRVLVATSALELGIDVGGVDAVVMVGYPGSISSLWQRAGRAGREGRRSLAIWIPAADPLDAYFLEYPELLTDGRPEDAIADPWNEELHGAHVCCAAAERPLRADEALLAPWIDLDALAGLRRVERDPVDGAPRWGSVRRYPHRAVRMRGGLGPDRVRLRDGSGATLGTTDGAAALRDLHPGAVYLHQGEAYVCARLDLVRGEATLLPHIEDYYTQPRSETDVEVLETWPHGRRPGEVVAADDVVLEPPPGVSVGRVRVRSRVESYVRKRYHHEGVLDERPLDLPEVSYDTQACWFDPSMGTRDMAQERLAAGMHALEHTLIGLLPAFVLCERADVGGVSYPVEPSTGRPLVFIYDGHPGGVGYARAGASVFLDWLAAARDLLERCPCVSGCPRCVLSPKCGNGNQMLDKRSAAELARALHDTLVVSLRPKRPVGLA
ncbi:MAG: DEAD/DEAH box helicase [Trueperaceae bacterium]|nr:DEAD/DEAH box helicase [Trueperaceae bacterium]